MTLLADDTVAELREFITNQNRQAKREFPRVGTTEHPTPWDKRHQAINDGLCDWEACVARDRAQSPLT